MEMIGGIIILVLLFKFLKTKITSNSSSISMRIFSLVFSLIASIFMTFFEFLKLLFGYSSNVYGSARFLGWFEKRLLINSSNKGLVVDGRKKISLEKSFVHCLITAPTGAGKSSIFIVGNIVSLSENGYSIVITDPSGELHKLTKKHLRKKGYDIKVLNVSDPQNSAKYNPLHRANTHSEIAKIADILVDTALPQSGNSDPFWNDSAKVIINLAIRALKQKDPQFQNLHNLNNILIQLGGSPAQKERIDRMMARDLDQASFELYTAFISQGERTFASVMSNAKVALSKISNDQNLAEITLSESLHFEKIRERPTAIFLIIPEHELNFYSFLSTLFYTQIFNFCMESPRDGQPYLPCFFLLDEFANTGRIKGIDTIISTIRKKKCSISLVIQDLAQLYANYGNNVASTIISNCLTQIYFPGLPLSTCQQLEKILGTATIQHREVGFRKSGAMSSSERERSLGRSLLTADEIRTLPNGRAILIHANKRPVLLKTTPWYKNSRIKRKIG